MFELIPQIVLIIALVVIVVVIARKINQTAEVDENKVKKDQIEFVRLVKKGFGYIWEGIKNIYYRLFRRMKTKAKEVKDKAKIIKDKEDEKELDQLAEEKPLAAEVASQATADDLVDMLEEASNLVGKGDLDKAEKKYIDIISKDPRNLRAYKGLGRIYSQQKNFKDAKESFKQVLEIDPQDREAKDELRKIGRI